MKSNFCRHNIDFYHLANKIHVVDTEHHYEDAEFDNFDLVFLNLQYYQIFEHFNLMNISDRILEFIIQILKDNHKKVMIVLPKSTDWLSISNFFVFLKKEIKELDFTSLQMIKIHIDKQLEYLLIIFDLPESIQINKIEEYDRRLSKNSIMPQYESSSSQGRIIRIDNLNNMNKIVRDENIDEFQEISSSHERMSEERLITINTFSIDDNNEKKLLKKETFKIGSNEDILSKEDLSLMKENGNEIKLFQKVDYQSEEMITLKTEEINSSQKTDFYPVQSKEINNLEKIETLPFEMLDTDPNENIILISFKKQKIIEYKEMNLESFEDIENKSIFDNLENKKVSKLQEKPIEISIMKQSENLNDQKTIQNKGQLNIENSLEQKLIEDIEINALEDLAKRTIEDLEVKVIEKLENQILEQREVEENETKEKFESKLFKNEEEQKNGEKQEGMLEEPNKDRDVLSMSESESNRCEVISFSTESPVFVE